jgi:signal transduction histidine kinase
LFKQTTIKLTIQYSLVVLGLIFAVTAGTYLYMDNKFGGDTPQVSGASDRALDRLRPGLVTIDLAALVLIPLVCYGLARRALRPIAESYEVQQQFVDNASHELRTPLTIISGELELALSRDRSKEEYRQALRTSLDEVEPLVRMTHSLLLLTRDNNELRAGFRLVDIKSVTNEIVGRQAVRARGKNVEVICDPMEDYNVRGDEDLMSQLVSILLDNALKYTIPNQWIQLSLEKEPPRITLRVRDSGIGMDRHATRHAFDRFWRGDQARSTEGYGLGLAIAKEITSLHRGSLTLSSPGSGKGTTAAVSLPVYSR